MLSYIGPEALSPEEVMEIARSSPIIHDAMLCWDMRFSCVVSLLKAKSLDVMRMLPHELEVRKLCIAT